MRPVHEWLRTMSHGLAPRRTAAVSEVSKLKTNPSCDMLEGAGVSPYHYHTLTP
jgi:hypothetical protein